MEVVDWGLVLEFRVLVGVILGILCLVRVESEFQGRIHGLKLDVVGISGDLDWCSCPKGWDHAVVWP